MSKILITCKDNNIYTELTDLLNGVGYETISADSENDALEKSLEFKPDIAIIDTSSAGIKVSSICKNLKLQNQNNDVQIILLTSKDSPSEEILVGADGYITKPLSENILIATVNAHLRIKKLLDILYTNNSELAKSLYQLNVLYDTSSQLAGTLDKTKLINIMNYGLEKSLNFILCYALVINEPENATLIINSQYPITEQLEEALKLRALIGYKSLFENNELPFELSMKNVKVEKHYKELEKNLDLTILVWDRLFSPISTSDQFFGTVEIIRQEEYSGEDSTCFQTVVKQVSLPLESALLYEEIQKTNKKLEKLEKLKSEFISIVSHELRTPLTSIKNSLDMMLSGRMGEINSTQNNFLNLAKRNVDRLSGIINDLLDLSKIEAGKMDFRFEPINIVEPIKFVLSTFEAMAQKKNISLTLNTASQELKVYGDSNKIEQVLSNLVSNAIKFTPDNGKVEVILTKVHSSELNHNLFYRDPKLGEAEKQIPIQGHYIQVSVKDTGIGIKKSDIPKVFDKFQQIESSLSRKVGGTGLGLPIAMQLIEAHRGKIWLESELDKGSIFSFIIPLMVQKNSFMFELDNYLQNAKHEYSNFALVVIKSDKLSGIQAIQKNKSEFFAKYRAKICFENNNLNIILPNTDKNRTKVFIKELFAQQKNKELKSGFAVYPDDAITSEEMLEIAQKNFVSV